MPHTRFVFAGIAAIGLAGPAAAQNSPCAALPLSGPVPAAGAPVNVPAAATPGGWQCPPGANLIPNTTPPMCASAAPTMVQGNPRAECYARLPFGPMQMVTSHARPIAGQCVQRVSVFPIIGRGVGFNDAIVSITPLTGLQLRRLTAVGPTVAPNNDPVQRGCTGPDCRLMQLTATTTAPAQAVVSISLPTRPAITRTIVLAPSCPAPPQQGCAPIQACTSGGNCPPPRPTC